MILHIVDALQNLIGILQTWAFTHIIEPILYRFGWMTYDDDAYDATYGVIVNIIQVLLSYALLRPFEALRPAEQWVHRKETRVDVFYTWMTKLGILSLLFFFLLQPAFDELQSFMVIHRLPSPELDAIWPGVTDQPLVSFLLYLVVLDFAGYWYHRWQHGLRLWWELHAVHHSQRQMSLWTDDRNHVVDVFLQAMFFAGISLFIGVAPGQYVWLVAFGNFLQSVQHANMRLPFDRVIRYVIVSPTFHRRHHAMYYGHEGHHHGCNFGVLFPWWDMVFRTASWNVELQPTGIQDQLPYPEGKDREYGTGWFSQQWLAMRSLCRVLWLVKAAR